MLVPTKSRFKVWAMQQCFHFFSATAVAMALSSACGTACALEFKVDLIQLDPWAFVNPEPNAAEPNVGVVVDLVKEFERRTGHTTRQTLPPYARVESNLEHGECDFSIMAWGPARARYANRGTAFVRLDFGVRAQKGVRLKKYSDLHNITTSATRGLKIDPVFDADTTLKKDYVVDYTMGIKKTALHRDSQAVAGSLSTINHIIHKLQLDGEFGDTIVFNTTYLTVAYSKKSAHPEAEAVVNAVFQAMVADGTARKIVNRWMVSY
jgi:polar amino acid transport system substrate-binding protein